MRCERCNGTGRESNPARNECALMGVHEQFLPAPYRPCLDCGGSGIAHCCEGERPDCAVDTTATPDQNHRSDKQE